jgi:hypothetical protein
MHVGDAGCNICAFVLCLEELSLFVEKGGGLASNFGIVAGESGRHSGGERFGTRESVRCLDSSPPGASGMVADAVYVCDDPMRHPGTSALRR